MDITITKLVVPARSRNGRIYNSKTVNQSSGSSGGVTGGGGETLWQRDEDTGTLSPATEGDKVNAAAAAFGDISHANYTEIDASGNVNAKGSAVYKKRDNEIFTAPLESGSAGSENTILIGKGATAPPEWQAKDTVLSSRVKVVFLQTADKSTTTTAEATVFGTGVGSRTLPATLAAGNYLRVNLQGYISTPGETNTMTFRVKYGSTTLVSLSGTLLSGMTQAVFDLELTIALRAAGASGLMRPAGSVLIENRTAGYPQMVRLQTTTDISVDTRTAQDLDITVQWGQTGNTLVTHVSSVELLSI